MNQSFEATCSDLENFIHVLSMKNVKVTFSNKYDFRPVIIKIMKLEKWACGGNP